jgi:prophage regulatory protein
LIRLKEVQQRVPYSRATIYRLVQAGAFPGNIPIGGRAVAWLESDVNNWIEQRLRAAARSGERGEAR